MFSPYGSSPENGTATWHAGPNFRGSYNILSTCLVTLGLCVWSALHLNIPAARQASKQKWRKMGWLLVGVFAPELVAWTANEQRRKAQRIHKIVTDALGQKPSPSLMEKMFNLFRKQSDRESPDAAQQESELEAGPVESAQDTEKVSRPKYRWTMVHSHYAAMGGFGFDPRQNSIDFLRPHDQSPHFVLNEKGIWLLAKTNNANLLATISEDEIHDKSKASGLAKTLVCIQAIWFCIQCIVRLSSGLPISLLEVNTFAHALCALLIYMLWWNKPLDVEVPTLLPWSGWPAFVASTTIPSSDYFDANTSHKPMFGHDRTDDRYINFVPLGEEKSSDQKWSAASEQAKQEPNQPALKSGCTRIYQGEMVHGLTLVLLSCVYGNPWHARFEPSGLSDTSFSHFDISSTQNRILALAGKFYSEYGNPFETEYSEIIRLHTSFAKNIGNWSKLAANLYNFEGRNLLALTIAGLCYGGIHLSAWSAYFPHYAEQLLWRVSGLTLASSGILVFCYFVFLNCVPPLRTNRWDPYQRSIWSDRIRSFIDLIHHLAVLLAVLFYCLCRVYLVVESYRNLAFLPDSAFKDPSWSQYIPHIS